MRLFVTGDTHGDVLWRCQDLKNKLTDLNKDDFLIICGDFGLIWGKNPPEFEWDEDRLKAESRQIKEIGKIPFNVLFVDGNHENMHRLNTEFPVIDFHGGKAHQISDNIFHLMRGEMYDFNGKKIFAFGGARSHDIWNLLDPKAKDYWDKVDELRNDFYRTIDESWWEDEIATEEEFRHGYETLKKHGWKCDYIFTHEAPMSDAMFLKRNGGVMCNFFEPVKRATDYKGWFYGHHHINKLTSPGTRCLYYDIMMVEDRKSVV